MKTKFLFLTLALFCATNFGFASFPVQKKAATEVVEKAETAKNVTTSDVKASTQIKAEEVGEYVSPAAGGDKSQLIALLLAIFVGYLGIHRFYLGYTWQGVVQLLTLGGCGIWSLIDLIRIITGDLKPKNGDYTDKL
jgi:TM2 domain-containing membrane protein YozV